MKALLLEKPWELSLTEVPTPSPRPGEALIKVKFAGICGSDVSAYTGHHPWCQYPIILGHEVAGEVVEVNADSRGSLFRPGEAVVIDPVVECGHCYPCRVGRYNCCGNMRILGIDFNGGFAEYLTMPLHRLHKVPEGMPLDRAVLTEPLSIGAQATSRAQLHPGDSVAIIGGGPIGLCALLLAKATTSVDVTVIDVLPERLELARKLGADCVLDANSTDVVEAVLERTRGEGANAIIEASGRPQAIETGLKIASAGSRLVVLGLIREETPFVPAALVKKEMSIVASRLNTNQFPKVLRTLAKADFPAELLVTQRAGLDESADLLRLAVEQPRAVMKALISC